MKLRVRNTNKINMMHHLSMSLESECTAADCVVSCDFVIVGLSFINLVFLFVELLLLKLPNYFQIF